jgi:hypothetical protein
METRNPNRNDLHPDRGWKIPNRNPTISDTELGNSYLNKKRLLGFGGLICLISGGENATVKNLQGFGPSSVISMGAEETKQPS